MSESSEDRTETASARRLEKAREQGDVPISKELNLLAGLAGGSAVLASQIGAAGSAPATWFAAMLRHGGADSGTALWSAMGTLLRAALPTAIGATACVIAATFLQTGFLVRLAALKPDISRVSPMKGVKRMLSPETLMQAAKSLTKLSVLSFALWMALRRVLPSLAVASRWPPAYLGHRLVAEASRLLMLLAGAQLAIGLVDMFWVRLRHAHKQRMTRQEQRDEHKESEGNPQVKQRIRQIARTRARRRMMAAVKTATVVVTNPTHYAVALTYERGAKSAPRVVAKGADDVADRIRQEAREHRIPMVANPPLARALYRVEIDTEIPVEHFKAVAEIVAYIWRLRTRPAL
ncbi:MAG: EscU/YscU/HrcU family type III secretion system export apparatus switch protein [Rhodospirillales bacterium]